MVLEAARLLPKRVAGLVLIDGSRQATGDPDAAEATARGRILAIQSTKRDAQLKRSPMKPGDSSPWVELLKAYGARVEIIPDTGHFTQLEAPLRVNQLIAEFCR